MYKLTIHRGPQTFSVAFSHARKLSELLEETGQMLVQPCGGRGVCGKCAVLLTGCVSEPNAAEVRCGARLSCQAVIHGDAEAILPQAQELQQIEAGSSARLTPIQPMPGHFGAAIDLGTTTLALRLYDMHTGSCLAVATMLNPQTSVSADVIGRIDAALKGHLPALQTSIETAIRTLLLTACARAGCTPEAVESLVITGNTTMLYLLTGRDPVTLSRAPFESDWLFGEERTLEGRRVCLPPCLHAFVGADTTCALLSSGMLDKPDTALLCDVGTNGEIALWHQGQLYVASTAAGPAFEGAGVSCGCGSIPGAIDRVWVQDGSIRIHTIADKKPVGLCGSGLVDAAAALLEAGIIDETGAMDADAFDLAPGVSLTQQDVRALQLAKAAIAAGMDSLLHAAGCPESAVTAVYLAGGFGSHLNIASAAQIGLISPAFESRVQTLGNAALDGAALMLMDAGLQEKAGRIRRLARHIRLDGNAFFSQRYIDAMMFGE